MKLKIVYSFDKIKSQYVIRVDYGRVSITRYVSKEEYAMFSDLITGEAIKAVKAFPQ